MHALPASPAAVDTHPASLGVGAALLAITLPTLVVFRLLPSATFFNQVAALVGWALFLATFVHAGASPRVPLRSGLAALLLVLALYAACAVASIGWTHLPVSLALTPIALMAAAALALLVGATAAQTGRAEAAFHAVCVALVAAGVLSAIVSAVQVFAPGWADNVWIAPTPFPGRAIGNLRQPNHLSSLLVWSIVAAIWLWQRGRLMRAAAAALVLVFVVALVLTSSRTAVLGVGLLALWGLLDRRLPRDARALLLLTPLVYLLAFGALTAWAHTTHHLFSGETRITDTSESPNSRWNIWANALALIGQHPWVGVGFGEFNFAWTLTPFANRPTAFFDHAHNLPLQFAVELGLPLATLLLALLAWALWRAHVAGRDAPLPQAGTLRAAFVMVLVITLHSLLEYPLWYAHFLLPTAFLFGLCLGEDAGRTAEAAPGTPAAPRTLLLACVLMLGVSAVSVLDYMRVARLYIADASLPPLEQRIAIGQRSWFFAHQAAHASATSEEQPARVMPAVKAASHSLLDPRLMMAWSLALYESGDVERARYVAQRLREFRHPDTKGFFSPCDDAEQRDKPAAFMCAPPTREFDYRDFE